MGTLTINTTSAQDARIISAFGKYLNTQDLTDPENPVPRDATAGEVKAKVIDMLKQVVFDQERKALVDAVTVDDLDPS